MSEFKFTAPEETILNAAALATRVSIPVGMGFIHYSPDHSFEPEDFRHLLNEEGIFLDYVKGRMVKLRIRMNPDGQWVVNEPPRSDYESWSVIYPSYKDLLKAAGTFQEVV